jgi:predicted PilT family ATPase
MIVVDNSVHITASKIKNVLLVSSNKIQVECARKFGVEAHYLLVEFEKAKESIRSQA